MNTINQQIEQAWQCYNSNLFKKATLHCNQVFKEEPAHTTAHLIAGLCFYTLNDLEKCVFHLKWCKEEREKNMEVWERYAYALVATGNAEEAKRTFENIIDKYPHEVRHYFNYGYTLVCNKEYRQGMIWLKKAEQAGYSSAKLFFSLGAASYNTGNYPATIEYLNKSISINTEHPEAPLLMGNAFYRLKNFSEAIDCYSRALYYNENNYEALYWRLMARLQMKDNKRKIVNLQAAQQDADKLLPVAHDFFTLKNKEGKYAHIAALRVSETGVIKFMVK